MSFQDIVTRITDQDIEETSADNILNVDERVMKSEAVPVVGLALVKKNLNAQSIRSVWSAVSHITGGIVSGTASDDIGTQIAYQGVVAATAIQDVIARAAV
ncbi:hypothetical protein ASF34_05935 [Methylobacterium sp. Leaf106]|nr:hypothetical protein ASF34_05935 [Methylobacterium sp. Leaf106]